MITKVIVSILLLCANTVFAQSDKQMNQALLMCAKMEVNKERLSCFDRLAITILPKNGPAVDKPTNAQQLTGSLAHKITRSVTLEKPAKLKQPEKLNQSSLADSFGQEHLEKSEEELAVQQQKFVFTVATVNKNAHKQWLIDFENGQSWKQTDSQFLSLSPGVKVELQKGVFNVVYLNKVGANRKIKVKRVK